MKATKKYYAGGDKKIAQYYLIIPMIEKQFFNSIPQISSSTPPEICVQILAKTLENFGNLMIYTNETLSFNDFLQEDRREGKWMHLKIMSSDLEELFVLTVKINEKATRGKFRANQMPHIKFIQCPSYESREISKELRKGQKQHRITGTIPLKIYRKDKIKDDGYDCNENKRRKRTFCQKCFSRW